MTTHSKDYLLIEDAKGLDKFINENQQISWLAFDTEFVGEKRYFTLLCCVQIATENGFYIIDTLKFKDIQPILSMITDPKLLKITHAGENDYRLLYNNYGIVPQNILDIQVAAGFIGYRYPLSFRKLVEYETGLRLSKGYTVSNWETRPMSEKQLKYALNDVVYLVSAWNSIRPKLEKTGRFKWIKEELKQWESEEYYIQDPHREALSHNLISNLNPQEQVFMIRLFEWRRKMAEKKDYSKEMILPSKYIGFIITNIKAGQKALKNHRRIPSNIVQNYWDTFNELFQQRITEEEKNLLEQIPYDRNNGKQEDLIMEMLQLLIKHLCKKQDISWELLMNRANMRRMRSEKDFTDPVLTEGWRAEVLGPEMVSWLCNRKSLEIVMENQQCILRRKN